MQILFDSRLPRFKTPFGCLKPGDTLTVTLSVKDAGETGVLFLLEKDGETPAAYAMNPTEEKNGYRSYSCLPPVTETGLYFYHFQIQTAQGDYTIYRDEKNRPQLSQGQSWQLTCYSRPHPISEEFCGLVMYQIFPDRFYRAGDCDTQDKLTPFWLHQSPEEQPVYQPDETGAIINNDFFGGNLQGIIKRLPYLQSLGVRALYLNPVFMAFSNHRYDTADYLRIDPLLGTNQDFQQLCDQAHALGMKILLDGVFSHTGSDSRYFDMHNRFGGGAYHNSDSPYRSWYQFTEYPHRYNAWWGISTLPCTEENDPGFRRFILTDENSVIRYWLRQGADGWRLDVADELPDDFLQALHKTVKEEKPEALVLGEVWEDASNKISYGRRRQYFLGESLDAVMNYVWRDAVIRFARGELSAELLNEAVMTLCEHYPPDTLCATMNLLSTHDTPRILTALGIDHVPESREARAAYHLEGALLEQGRNRLHIAAFLLFCLPGSVCIYYGDEIGMEGFEDPFNRGYMGDRPADEDILSCFRQLAALKNASPALRFGRLEPAFCEEGVYGFYRIKDDERLFCAVNVSPAPRQLAEQGELLFEKNCWQEGGSCLLLPYGCAAIRISPCHKRDERSI